MKKRDFIRCIERYFDNKYDIQNAKSGTPKISVYYMIGYLGVALGPKDMRKLESYMDKIMESRKK